MLRRILDTSDDSGALVARVALAVVIFPHGAQKVLGWFGGAGFTDTMGFFTGNLGIPWSLALLAFVAEFLGPLGLISGLLTRVAAFGVGVTMLVAAVMVHAPNGFFMNWSGDRGGEGFEYHILTLGLALALTIRGGGRFSLDSVVAARLGGSSGARR